MFILFIIKYNSIFSARNHLVYEVPNRELCVKVPSLREFNATYSEKPLRDLCKLFINVCFSTDNESLQCVSFSTLFA